MKPDWFLVANSSRARLIEREPGCPMTVLRSFAHPSSREGATALDRDAYGRQNSSWTAEASSYEPSIDAHRKESIAFAREIAAQLDAMVLDGGCRSLTVFASSPFLGIIREHLGSATRRKLAASHDSDLTAVGLTELERRIGHDPAHTGH